MRRMAGHVININKMVSMATKYRVHSLVWHIDAKIIEQSYF